MMVTQTLASGVAVRQDFTKAVRPVFFQTEFEEWLYATHGGTLFIVDTARKVECTWCARHLSTSWRSASCNAFHAGGSMFGTRDAAGHCADRRNRFGLVTASLCAPPSSRRPDEKDSPWRSRWRRWRARQTPCSLPPGGRHVWSLSFTRHVDRAQATSACVPTPDTTRPYYAKPLRATLSVAHVGNYDDGHL